MAKLKWKRRAPTQDSSNLNTQDLEDERGVTLCALEDDDRYNNYDLEDGEELERIDISMTALNRDDSN